MRRFRKKNKIFHKYEDFFTSADLKDPDTPQKINLTIEDFNAKGQVANPRAPCVVSTIDPRYIKDGALHIKTKRFRVKTDILRLREITRNKFVIYATQECFLEKQRHIALQEHTYKRIINLQEFAADSLSKIESDAFNELTETQKKLSELLQVKVVDDLRRIVAEHQRVVMEVKEVYSRFIFLLKLIGYFDEIISPEDINEDDKQSKKLVQLPENCYLQICEYDSLGKPEVSNIMAYMDNVIRPYLSKRNHLNAEIWIKGYERTRQKIFNFNRRFTHVALLNHLVSIVNTKTEKTMARRDEKQTVLIDPIFLANRVKFLMKRSETILNDFEKNQKKDKLQLKLNAIVPIILERIGTVILQTNGCVKTNDKVNKKGGILKPFLSRATSTKPISAERKTYETHSNNTMMHVENLHWHLLTLLQNLENYEPAKCRQIELCVRRRIEIEKDASRRALIKQVRLQNWRNHFIKHEVLRQLD